MLKIKILKAIQVLHPKKKIRKATQIYTNTFGATQKIRKSEQVSDQKKKKHPLAPKQRRFGAELAKKKEQLGCGRITSTGRPHGRVAQLGNDTCSLERGPCFWITGLPMQVL